MPADRIAFRDLVSVHTTPKVDVTGVTSVTESKINDLAGHTACAVRVTRVTEPVRGGDGHRPCDPRERSCVAKKPEERQLLNSSGHTVTRSHPKIWSEEKRRPTRPDMSALTDWLAHFEERAAIREYEGGLGRAEAERLALDEAVATLGPMPGDVPARNGKGRIGAQANVPEASAFGGRA